MSPPWPEADPAQGSPEERRLTRLGDHDLSAGQRLSEYDELARLAAMVCDAPVAYASKFTDAGSIESTARVQPASAANWA